MKQPEKAYRIGGKFLSPEELDSVMAPINPKDRQPTSYEFAILKGLQGLAHVYEGDVDPVVIASRRAKNRNARRARRGNVAAIAKQARAARGEHRAARRFRRGQAPWIPGISAPVDAEVVEVDLHELDAAMQEATRVDA